MLIHATSFIVVILAPKTLSQYLGVYICLILEWNLKIIPLLPQS